MTHDSSYAAMTYGAPAADRNAAVAELFTAQHVRLVTLAHMLVGDLATAEDVVQDAFASLYRRWPWLRDKGAAVGYVQTAVVNGARTQLRKRRHLSYVSIDLGADIETDAADANLLRKETYRALVAGLVQLPIRQREVVVLRYYLDRSEQEIATMLSISRGSVKKHASRALATLGARLEGQR